ncbi:Arc family DNA binding domain-containing protein [Aquimarina sp. W85]
MLRIDPDTFKLIEKWADDEFRSVNGQLEWMIQKSLREAKRLKSNKSNE